MLVITRGYLFMGLPQKRWSRWAASKGNHVAYPIGLPHGFLRHQKNDTALCWRWLKYVEHGWTWRYDIPWYSMIFHDIPWYSMIFHDIIPRKHHCSSFPRLACLAALGAICQAELGVKPGTQLWPLALGWWTPSMYLYFLGENYKAHWGSRCTYNILIYSMYIHVYVSICIKTYTYTRMFANCVLRFHFLSFNGPSEYIATCGNPCSMPKLVRKHPYWRLLEPMSWESHVKTIENQLSPIGFPIKKKKNIVAGHIMSYPHIPRWSRL